MEDKSLNNKASSGYSKPNQSFKGLNLIDSEVIDSDSTVFSYIQQSTFILKYMYCSNVTV